MNPTQRNTCAKCPPKNPPTLFYACIVGLLLFGITGCTSIQVRYPLLTDENSDTLVFREQYFLQQFSGEQEPSAAFQVVSAAKDAKTKGAKVWTVKDGNSDMTQELRAKVLEGSRYLVQIKTTAKIAGGESEKTVLGLAIIEGHEILGFSLSSTTAKAAGDHPLLAKLRSHVTYEKDTLIFDEIAVAQYGDAIINYFKSLPRSDLGLPARFRTTTDKNIVQALWSKKSREVTEEKKEHETEVANLSVGDVMVIPPGFGRIGWKKVVIRDIRDASPRVKVRDYEGDHIEWLNPGELITVGEANAQKAQGFSKALEKLFPPRN